MKYQELSAEDQNLLNTDLGEFDKVAAAEMSLAQEMYATGFEKLATETAGYLDTVFAKVAEEDKKEDEKEDEDEETKKTAEELGAFIERGFFDGLRKLGAERHGDETVYLLPYLEEKVAEGGKMKALREFGSKAWKATKDAPGKAWNATKDAPGKAWEGAKKLPGKAKAAPGKAWEGTKKIPQEAREGAQGLSAAITGKGVGNYPGAKLTKEERMAALKAGGSSMGKAVAKGTAIAGGAGALGYGGYRGGKALFGKKDGE